MSIKCFIIPDENLLLPIFAPSARYTRIYEKTDELSYVKDLLSSRYSNTELNEISRDLKK